MKTRAYRIQNMVIRIKEKRAKKSSSMPPNPLKTKMNTYCEKNEISLDVHLSFILFSNSD